MTARPYMLTLVALSLVAACAPRTESPTPATQADRAAIDTLREQELAAVTTGDTTMAYLADDTVMMPPNEPAIVGIPAARAWLEGFLKQYRTSLSYTDTKVTFGGDLAVEEYRGTLTLTPVEGGASMTETLKGVHVYRRDAGGAWKMVLDVWNSDTAAAPPPPPAQ